MASSGEEAQIDIVAGRLVAGIEALSIPHERCAKGVITVSCGVPDASDLTLGHQAAVIGADRALYEAKRAGKNTVFAASGLGPQGYAA